MYRIDDASAAPTLPTPEAAGTEGFFTEGTPGVTPATAVRGSWLNAVQESLRNIVVGTGLTVSKTVYTRVLEGIKRLAGANVRAITGPTTLTADDAGYLGVTVAANATLTLPLANAAGGTPIRLTLARLDVTASVVTLARAGSDTINGLTTGVTLPVGATVTLLSDGVTAWRLVGSSGLGQIDVFTASGTATAPWWHEAARPKPGAPAPAAVSARAAPRHPPSPAAAAAPAAMPAEGPSR